MVKTSERLARWAATTYLGNGHLARRFAVGQAMGTYGPLGRNRTGALCGCKDQPHLEPMGKIDVSDVPQAVCIRLHGPASLLAVPGRRPIRSDTLGHSEAAAQVAVHHIQPEGQRPGRSCCSALRICLGNVS